MRYISTDMDKFQNVIATPNYSKVNKKPTSSRSGWENYEDSDESYPSIDTESIKKWDRLYILNTWPRFLLFSKCEICNKISLILNIPFKPLNYITLSRTTRQPVKKTTKGGYRILRLPKKTEYSNDIDYSQYEGIIKVATYLK